MFNAHIDVVGRLRDRSCMKVIIGLLGNPIGGTLGAPDAKANMCAGVTSF